MKPLLQKLPLSENSSFVCRTYRTPYFETPWHQHDEFEIVMIQEGNGNALIGDYFGEYKPGDVFFLGSNLPHWFRKSDQDQIGSALVIHFLAEFWGKSFLALPEMRAVYELFILSKRGLKLREPVRQRAEILLKDMEVSRGVTTIYLLLRCFEEMIQAPDDALEILGSGASVYKALSEANPIARVFDYTFANYQREITLQEVADLVNMSCSTFCRHFKQSTKRTYIDFLKEVRIGHACRLLTESDWSVFDICYDSGYNNTSNFSKQFRELKKMTPLLYRKQFKGNQATKHKTAAINSATSLPPIERNGRD